MAYDDDLAADRAVGIGPFGRDRREAGNGVAYLWLGDTYYFPSGELRDYGKAFEYYSKAAEAGVADAMGNLGVMYGSGYGVEQDYAKAAQWYEKAIDAGCAWAMRNLANYYLYGRGNIGRDEEKGVDLLLRAAETGFPSAYSTLGSYYQSNRKNDKAEEYLLKAGEGGDTNAMFTLGDFYSGVGGMAHRDIDKAIEWYTRSTQTDNPSAYGLFWLGQIYYNGSLVGADHEKAFELLNSAVEIWKRDGSHDFDQPYLQAVTMIGDMYKAGQGVEKNEEKAAEYYAWAKQLASG